MRRFDVVEVQQTFYDPPSERTLMRWRDSVPPSFEFTLKAWQLITHDATSPTYRRLRRDDVDRSEAGSFRASRIVDEAWQTTLRCADLLRATCVVFQCPASFRPTPENVANLRAFFTRTPRPPALRFLWEPRGKWPDELVRELCTELDLVHVIDAFTGVRSVTPAHLYYRLHGRGNARYSYKDGDLQILAKLTANHPDAYVMFNNLPRVGDAERFKALLRSGSPI